MWIKLGMKVNVSKIIQLSGLATITPFSIWRLFFFFFFLGGGGDAQITKGQNNAIYLYIKGTYYTDDKK